eukprot:403333808
MKAMLPQIKTSVSRISNWTQKKESFQFFKEKSDQETNIKIYQNDENTKSNSNFNSVFNNLDENLDSISNVMAQPSQIGQVSSQSRNNDLAQNFKSISLPKIAGFSNPHDSYNSQLEKIVSNNKTRFNGNSLLKKQVALDKQSNRYSSVNSSMAVQSIPYFLDSPDFQSRKNAYQALGNGGGLVSDISRTNQSQIYSQSKTNKDQQVSVWDALRMHDLKKYQIEQYQSKMKKLERQKQLKEYLEQQVHNKHFTVNGIQNSQKLHDREMINQTIDVLKQKEERQKQQRKDQLLKSVEFNLQNKTTKDFMIQQQLQNSLTPNNADGGIHVLFKLDQQKVQEGKQKKLETQNLLKNLISTKEITKKSENENEKVLEQIAVKRTDEWLKKSSDDYQHMIKSKDTRNQLIIQAHKDRAIRNYSTIEQERGQQIERLAEQQQQELKMRQSFILDEKQRLMSKINKDLRRTHMDQIEERKQKQQEEKFYNKIVENELVNRNVNDYYEYQSKIKSDKINKQQMIKRELEKLIRQKREMEIENKLKLNPIEFSMNKRSLKELGLANYHDQYEDTTSYFKSQL